ncbi:hypothetical protein Plhal703r1_c04g0023891 [Plasmopara halstedii]
MYLSIIIEGTFGINRDDFFSPTSVLACATKMHRLNCCAINWTVLSSDNL